MAIDIVCDSCKATYHLKDEFAGKKLRCKQCESVMIVPMLAGTGDDRPSVDRGYHRAFARDKFLMNQKRIAISEKYYIFDERQNPILYIERPAHFLMNLLAAFAAVFTIIILGGASVAVGMSLGADRPGDQALPGIIAMIAGGILSLVAGITLGVVISPKRHISVYTDDTKTDLLLEVFQDRKVNIIRSTYTVKDPRDGILGRFSKNYLYNVIRKRWYVFGPDGGLFMLAMEDSLLMSLFRRILPPIIAALLARTNFIIIPPGGTKTIGEFNRKFTLFDKYVLDMSADTEHVLDRRMAISLGVLLDTGERR